MYRVFGLLCFILTLFTKSALADDDSWQVTLGLSLKQNTLDVYRAGRTSPEGALSAPYQLVPDFGLESSLRPLTADLGYKFAFNFGYFSMSTQEVGEKDKDLGTSAKGFYLYAMPVLIYDLYRTKESALSVGFGAGLGHLDARGNLYFTESDQSKHSFSFSQLAPAFGLLVDYQLEKWSVSITAYGPEVAKQGYEYNLFDLGFTLRRRFDIRFF